MRNVNVVIDKQVKLKKALRINDRILLYKDKMDNRSVSLLHSHFAVSILSAHIEQTYLRKFRFFLIG